MNKAMIGLLRPPEKKTIRERAIKSKLSCREMSDKQLVVIGLAVGLIFLLADIQAEKDVDDDRQQEHQQGVFPTDQ